MESEGAGLKPDCFLKFVNQKTGLKMEICQPDEESKIKIIAKQGYTGFYYPGECACTMKDVAPCGEDPAQCEPGYAFFDPEKPEDFIVRGVNQEPTEEEWEKIMPWSSEA